jgi:hypothetical protein
MAFTMNSTKKIYPLVFTASVLMLASGAWAQEPQEPKYAADVPEFLLTPDKVETDLLGDLEFFDGMPSESTVKKSYDFLDLSRGVHAFLNGMPATSTYAFLEGLKQAGLETRRPGDDRKLAGCPRPTVDGPINNSVCDGRD